MRLSGAITSVANRPASLDHRGGGVSVELAEEAFADRLIEAGDMIERK